MALIVIGYDGSRNARAATHAAGDLFGGQSALVVTAWSVPATFADSAMTVGGDPTAVPRAERLDAEDDAHTTVDEGVELARAAGLRAQPRLVRAVGPVEIAHALLDVAADRGGDVVVVGRRGVSRIESLVRGSVSDAALRDGRGPVLVVPGDSTRLRAAP